MRDCPQCAAPADAASGADPLAIPANRIRGALDDDIEPYCTACGAWAGMFHGIDGWRHFRGDPASGGQREQYDADHVAVIGWTVPAGRAPVPVTSGTPHNGRTSYRIFSQPDRAR